MQSAALLRWTHEKLTLGKLASEASVAMTVLKSLHFNVSLSEIVHHRIWKPSPRPVNIKKEEWQITKMVYCKSSIKPRPSNKPAPFSEEES